MTSATIIRARLHRLNRHVQIGASLETKIRLYGLLWDAVEQDIAESKLALAEWKRAFPDLTKALEDVEIAAETW